MRKAIIDTEEILRCVIKSDRFMSVFDLEKEAGLPRGEILKWRASVPSMKNLCRAANALDEDANKFLTIYDPSDEEVIVLHRVLETTQYWYGNGRSKIIYSLCCRPTNRRYIGASRDLETRLISHIANLKQHKHRNKEMQTDFDKYGESSFEMEKIGDFDGLIANHLEYLFMYYYDTRNNIHGYNRQDNHGTKGKEIYLEDIEMLKSRSVKEGKSVIELLNTKRIVLEHKAPF